MFCMWEVVWLQARKTREYAVQVSNDFLDPTGCGPSLRLGAVSAGRQDIQAAPSPDVRLQSWTVALQARAKLLPILGVSFLDVSIIVYKSLL